MIWHNGELHRFTKKARNEQNVGSVCIYIIQYTKQISVLTGCSMKC